METRSILTLRIRALAISALALVVSGCDQHRDAPRPKPSEVVSIQTEPSASTPEHPTRQAATDPGEVSDSPLPRYELTLSAEDLEALDNDPGSNRTYPGSLRVEGDTYPSVQVRYRGQWARSWPKKPLKIFLDREKPFHGHHSVNFSSAWRDPAFVREALAYHVYAACGAPASRARVVQIRVNGRFRGVYVEVEQVDKTLLRRFGLRGASLFKTHGSNRGDERDLGSLEMFTRFYEEESGKTNALEQLQQFCHRLAGATNAAEFFTRNVDLDRYVNYLAASVLVQHWDGYNKNHFLVYDEGASQKWLVLPWDLDRTFGDHWNQSFGYAELPILLGTRQYPGVTGWNRMQDRFLSDLTLRRRFLNRLRELLDGEFTTEKLFPVVDRWEQELGSAAALDRRRWPSPAGGLRDGIAELKQFILDRRAFLKRELEKLEQR